MKSTFPTSNVTQELANEVAAAGRMLDKTLPPDAHHTMAYEAFATRWKSGAENVGQRWSCVILDGWSDQMFSIPQFSECRQADSPMSAVSLCLDAWRAWRDAVESKRLAAEALEQEQFDAQNIGERFEQE